MNNKTLSLFLVRIRNVCTFDSTVYQDVRHSFLPAFLVVLLVAFAHGVGGVIRARINGWDEQESFVFGIHGEIVFWIVQSLVYYFMARLFLNRGVKAVEILSAVGYSIFPGILVLLAALLQLVSLSIPLLVVLAVYRLATCTFALRQLLKIKLIPAFFLVILGTAVGFISLGMVIRFVEFLVK